MYNIHCIYTWKYVSNGNVAHGSSKQKQQQQKFHGTKEKLGRRKWRRKMTHFYANKVFHALDETQHFFFVFFHFDYSFCTLFFFFSICWCWCGCFVLLLQNGCIFGFSGHCFVIFISFFSSLIRSFFVLLTLRSLSCKRWEKWEAHCENVINFVKLFKSSKNNLLDLRRMYTSKNLTYISKDSENEKKKKTTMKNKTMTTNKQMKKVKNMDKKYKRFMYAMYNV